jgi:hypothetical protein
VIGLVPSSCRFQERALLGGMARTPLVSVVLAANADHELVQQTGGRT